MDADYNGNSKTTTKNNNGKKKSAFSKALHATKPTFDPGEH
jgi:hypothetical protein